MYWWVLYTTNTRQIEHHESCSNVPPNGLSFDPTTHTEARLVDPDFDISRDHTVLLDAQGQVIATTPSPNPVQPVDPDAEFRLYVQDMLAHWTLEPTPVKWQAVHRIFLKLCERWL